MGYWDLWYRLSGVRRLTPESGQSAWHLSCRAKEKKRDRCKEKQEALKKAGLEGKVQGIQEKNEFWGSSKEEWEQPMAEIHGGISFNVWFMNEMAFQVLGVIQQKFK